MMQPSIKRFLLFSFMASLVLVWILMFICEVIWGRIYFQLSLTIMLIALPILCIMLYFCVGYSLRHLILLSREITNRRSTHLQPIKRRKVPIEVQPIISELNNLFVNLRYALIRNKRFAGDAAHELKTPLAALKTQAQVALNAKAGNELEQALKNLNVGVDRCTRIIEQLLTLSRLGPEATLEDCHDTSLLSIATEIIALLVPKALNKEIEIDLEAKDTLPLIYANETAIGILVRNLVDNAIRYTPEGGQVHVKIFEKGKKLILRVTDTGSGIPEELHERVFERFFRVLGTNTIGSGLGLAIVQQIASLHHADIQLGKPEEHEGLQFDVIFKAK